VDLSWVQVTALMHIDFKQTDSRKNDERSNR